MHRTQATDRKKSTRQDMHTLPGAEFKRDKLHRGVPLGGPLNLSNCAREDRHGDSWHLCIQAEADIHESVPTPPLLQGRI